MGSNNSKPRLEYSEKIVYLHKGQIHIHDIKKEKILRSIPHNIVLRDELTIALACQGTNMTRVVGEIITSKENESLYEVVSFDKNFDLQFKYQINFPKGKTRPTTVLLTVMGKADSNSDSVERATRSGRRMYTDGVLRLPYGASVITREFGTEIHSPETRNYDQVRNICYDKYRDVILILLVQSKKIFVLEEWKRIVDDDEKWIFLRRARLKGFWRDKLMSNTKSQTYHLECGRHHISIGMSKNNELLRVYVLGKNNFTTLRRFSGCHPTFHDDYEEWFQTNVDFLKSIQCVSMLDNLLGLVLLYVG